MSKVQTFTSTGSKLIHHPSVVKRIQWEKIGTPVSLQVAPTSKCNLKCIFCSNTNRDKHEDIDLFRLQNFIHEMWVNGLKTIEITGGGDPTMYYGINELIHYTSSLPLKVGMISNGLLLKERINQKNLDRLHWLRISMNCLDYADSIDIPSIKGTLGFSYVMNDKSYPEVLDRLDTYVKKFKPSYVRIVPNCQATQEQQEFNNKALSEKVSQWGEPYFYQEKKFEKPKNCWWSYFKPFLLHDGFIYPCSSVVLNDSAERQFHSKFRLCEMKEFMELVDKEMVSFDNKLCDHCVFTQQNNLIDTLINKTGMEDFI
jgi:MoaA/NifB/PqqE/SkfB family radical SAM enzyme